MQLRSTSVFHLLKADIVSLQIAVRPSERSQRWLAAFRIVLDTMQTQALHHRHLRTCRMRCTASKEMVINLAAVLTVVDRMHPAVHLVRSNFVRRRQLQSDH